MMEHANLHQHPHHQLQDGQLKPSSSSSSSSNYLLATAPSSYGGEAGSTQNGWTQNFNLNINSFNPNCDRVVLNPRSKNNNPAIIAEFNSSMAHNLSPNNWHTDNIGGSFTSQLSHHELSETNFPNFTDMLSTSSPSSIGDSHELSYMKNNHQRDITDLTEKLLLKSVTSPGFPLNGHHQFTRGAGGSGAGFSSVTQDSSSSGMGGLPGRSGSFGQIFPSTNISNLYQSHSASLGPPGSFDMNPEALNLLDSTRFGGCFGQDSLGPYLASPSSLGLDQMQSSPTSSSNPSQILSPFSSEITSEPKRSRSSGTLTESNKAKQAVTKKTRVEPRASCPPLKVRKEKLGDRVAALQQLVAPFGKTDTASVLMEAIGFINFLQNQVETLSVPYMKSSRNKSNKSTHMGSANIGTDDGSEEPKRDLRSRGLCLVPLSCMSYVTNIDGGNFGGGIWPPPNFGGDT